MPKVSIIVPVYNVEKYLTKCLTTLVEQTLDDYEIIVVNDGSPDNSQEIIDDFKEKYPEKIKSFIKENGGLSDARNFGIKKATGDYIGFVDSDDYVNENMFEKLYKKAKSKKADMVVCSYNSVFLDKKGDVKKSKASKIENTPAFGKSIYESPDILAYSRSFAWNKLYKRELFNDFQFPTGQIYEDSAVVYNILSAANKVVAVSEPLYNYVGKREGAITATVDKRIFDVFKSCDSIIKYYKKIGQFETFKDQIEYLCIVHVMERRFVAFQKHGGLRLKLKYIDRTFDFLNKNFPNWQDNPYCLKRISGHLASYPVPPFFKAIQSRTKSKRYFIHLYLQRLLPRVTKALKRRIFRIPTVNKELKKSAKELSGKQLRELQLITLGILKTVVEFCNKNGIRYYLSEGSLLGAVRHEGFIPWDDDLDIAMPRDDYEKFIKLWGKKKIDDCRLFHQSTYKKYYLTFAKVVFMGKCRFLSLIRKGLKSMNDITGPGIDIFPLDETGPISKKLLSRASKIRKYRNILLTKVYYFKTPKKRKRYRFAAAVMSYKAVQRKLVSLYTADKGKGKQYVTNFASSYPINKEIFQKDWFEPARTVKFEDLTVTIPYDSEKILTQIYGDYMTPPPEEERVCRHQYVIKRAK